MKQHKRTVYEQRKRDRKRLLKVKEIIDEVGHQIIKIKRITNQIK